MLVQPTPGLAGLQANQYAELSSTAHSLRAFIMEEPWPTLLRSHDAGRPTPPTIRRRSLRRRAKKRKNAIRIRATHASSRVALIPRRGIRACPRWTRTKPKAADRDKRQE